MPRRYFLEQPISTDAQFAELSGQEAQHLSKVMRAKPGDAIQLFDGSGYQYDAIITEISRHSVTLAIQNSELKSCEASRRVTVAVSLPKGDRQKWLIEKLCEIGVNRVIPLKTQRSVAQPTENVILRLQRSVIEASKQCGRNTLMEIQSSQTFEDLITQSPGDRARVIAHPYNPDGTPVTVSSIAHQSVLVAVGPEGGFTDQELDAAINADFSPVAIGERILRIETAAIAISSLLIYADNI